MPEVRIPEFNPPKSGPRRLDWSALPEEARRRMVDSLREAGEQAMSAKSPGPQLDLEKLRGALRTLLDEVYEAMDEAMELAKRSDSTIWPFLYRIMSKRLVEVGEMPLSDPMGPGRMVPHSIKFYVGFAPSGYVGRALPGHSYVYYVDYDLLEAVASKGLSREGIEAWRAFVLQNMAHEMTHLVQAEFYPAAFSDYPEGGQTGPAYKAHPTEREARWASIDALLRMHGPTPEFWRTLSELFGDELRRSKDRVLALVEKYRNRILDASGSLMTADALARKLGLTEKAMRAFMDTMEPQRGRLETAASDLRRPEHARRILMLVAPKDFLEAEYEGPHTLFLERGMDVSVATGGKEALGTLGGKIATDLDVADAKADGFDALFVVGGKGMVGFSDDKGAQVLLRAFVEADKPVAMICHGPLLAAKADLAKGLQMTGWPEIRSEVVEAGAKWTGMPVERDGDIFTAIGPEDAESLADILARRLDEAPMLSNTALLDEAGAMRKLAALWRIAAEIDRPLSDEEIMRLLDRFESEGPEGREEEPVPPGATPRRRIVAPTVRPAPVPAVTDLGSGRQRSLAPKNEWNVALELRPPRTDGTWPDLPEAPPPGFPFAADDLKDGPSLRALFRKPETWAAIKEMAANPAKRGLLQSYLLPVVVLVIGKAWWEINKRHRQLGNAPFGLFSPDEYKEMLAGEEGKEGEVGRKMEETVAGRAFISLINWQVTKIFQFYLATGSIDGSRIDGYLYEALNNRMVADAGKRHGFERRRQPVCAFCRSRRVIETTPPFLARSGKHQVQEEGKTKSRPLFKCPTCEDLVETKEQELRLKEQGAKNVEDGYLGLIEDAERTRRQLAGDPDDKQLLNRLSNYEAMLKDYAPQVEALRRERDSLRAEVRNRRNMLGVPYSHIMCINEACPGGAIPLTFVDWQDPFWAGPAGDKAKHDLASFYGIGSPTRQNAEDAPPEPAVSERAGKRPPQWMWDIPFRCPFDGYGFTPREAFGRGRAGADGTRMGGLFVDPPRSTVWSKPYSLEEKQEKQEERAGTEGMSAMRSDRIEDVKGLTGIDITTDSNQFLTDQDEKLYYEELSSALRQELYRRKELHVQLTGGLNSKNPDAKLQTLLNDAVLEWSYIHPLHLVGYYTKRAMSVRRKFDPDTGEVTDHLEVRSLNKNAAEQVVSSLMQTWFKKILQQPDGWQLLRKHLTIETYDNIPPQCYFVTTVQQDGEGELEAKCHFRYAKGSPIGEKPRQPSYQKVPYLALVEGIWNYDGEPDKMDMMTPIPQERGDAMVAGRSNRISEMDFHNSYRIVLDSATSLVPGSAILVKGVFMPRNTGHTLFKRVMDLRKDLKDPDDDMAGIMDVVGRLADKREDDTRLFARWRKSLRQLGMPEQLAKFDEALRRRLEEEGMTHSASLLVEAKDPLSSYKGKREFGRTPEPEGKEKTGSNKHRFVIQRHFAHKAGQHFDLRLENDEGALSSWSIPKHRLPKGKEKLLAVKTEDHPIEYMGFKGEIPEGEYGAGTMEIHDSGTYEPIEEGKSKVVFKLKGKKEKGTYRLFRAGDGKRWLIMEGSGGKEASGIPPLSKRADFTFRPHAPSHRPGEWTDYRLPPDGGTQLSPEPEDKAYEALMGRSRSEPSLPPAPESGMSEPKWTLVTALGFGFGWYDDFEQAQEDAERRRREFAIGRVTSSLGQLVLWKLKSQLGGQESLGDSKKRGERLHQLVASPDMQPIRYHLAKNILLSIRLRAPEEWRPEHVGTRRGEGITRSDLPDETWVEIVREVRDEGQEMLDRVADWILEGGDVFKRVVASRLPLSRRAAMERLPIHHDPAMWTDEQLAEAVSRPELFGGDKERFRLAVEQLAKRGLAKRVEPKDIGEWRERGWWLLMWAGIPLAFYDNIAKADMAKRLLADDFAKDGTQPVAAAKFDPIHTRLRWQLDEAMDLGPAEDYEEADRRRGRAGTAVDELATHPFYAKRRKEFAERALNISKAPALFDAPKEAVPTGPRPTESNADAAEAAITDMRYGETKPEFIDALVGSQEAARDAGDELVEDAAKRLTKRLEAERAGFDPERMADDDALELALIGSEG